MPSLRNNPDAVGLFNELRFGLRLAGRGSVLAAAAGGRLGWLVLKRLLGIVVVLIALFEQWGWRPLAALLGRLARFKPIAAMEAIVAGLPPYAALFVFTLPVAVLIPLKLGALFLIAAGHHISAIALFIAAKIIGTALVARLYHLTQPQLMQIGWLREAIARIAPKLQVLREEVRTSWAWRYGRIMKWEAKRMSGPVLIRAMAQARALFAFSRRPAG
jgi:hypothetical protein